MSTAVGALFLLLAVGALIGTWNMAGTIPTLVTTASGLLNPSIFFSATAAICAVVGMVTGSSWTTAGTLGVAFVGMANAMGSHRKIAAGAVISGADFGDKMTPLSETTISAPTRRRGTHDRAARAQHVLDRGPRTRAQPGRLRGLGLAPTHPDAGPAAAQSTSLAEAFNLSWISLAAAGAPGGLHRAQGPALPCDIRRCDLRRRPRLLHPMGG